MTIGVLPEQGGSLANLATSGQDGRFIVEYLARYGAAFDRVLYFSYADERRTLPPNCTLVPNGGRLHRWVYAFLLPFLHARQFRQCDVLRVMQLTGEVPAIIAKVFYRVPFVATYGYQYDRHALADGSSRARALLFRLRNRVAVTFADRIIVTNAEIQRTLERRVGPARVAYVPNAVDTARFAPGDDGERENPPVVLYVGRLSAQKNLTLLIDAAAACARPLRLRFVGGGPHAAMLARHAEQKGVSLELAGPVAHEDLPREFQRATVFALPSLIEGHPKALIEAMSCGCACIGARAPGIEGVIDDGRTGRLAGAAVDEFAQGLQEMLDDSVLRKRLGGAARAHAISNFNISATLAAEIAVLRDVAGRNAQ